MLNISGKCTGEIDVKRFYMPGIVATEECPKCRKECTKDFSSEYVSHPVIGEPETVYFYCRECENEWQSEIVIILSVEAVKK